MELNELRKQQYLYHINHDRSFYTWLKARFYMEGAARSVCWLETTNIHPSVLTLLYGLLGIIGGILLSVPNKLCIYLALVIFFTKGILDWSDGHLARIKGKVSKKGRIYDILAGYIGIYAFYMGLGAFLSHFYGIVMIPYVFGVVYICKKLGVPVSRACVVDSIIFLLGVTTVFLTF